AFQSARVGRTEVVLIAGEPGIGKSRLLTEFIGLATSAEDGVRSDAPRVLRWTFSRVNQRSYAGFIEPLLVELRIDPNDPEASAKLPDKLRELNFANPELVAPTLAQFFHLAGATEPPSDSEEWKRSMFISVYDVIASLARERPHLYVLEDLHFADSASLELLWFVASRASRVPILLLLAQRAGPGSPEPRPVRTNFSQLVLEPLSDEEAARIIDATFDWMPDELRDKIVARAGGNPFFIEESIRSLVDSGAVAKDDKGEWQLRERPAALEVPATLHGVVAARIDRLPPSAKETIQLASVIGQRFGDRVLREAGDRDPRARRGRPPRRAGARGLRKARTDRGRREGPVSDRTRSTLSGRERGGTFCVRACADDAGSARSERRRGGHGHRAHGRAMHEMGREAPRPGGADRAGLGDRRRKADAREGPAARRQS